MAKIRIGRSSTNEAEIKDNSVSRNHAEIEDLGGGLYRLTDVGSSSGTFVKEGDTWNKITSVEVGADALLRFGNVEVKLSYIVSGDKAPVAQPAGAGGGWSGRSRKFKMVIIAGGTFVLLLVGVLGLSLAGVLNLADVLNLAGGEGATTAGAGAAKSGETTSGAEATGGSTAKPRRRVAPKRKRAEVARKNLDKKRKRQVAKADSSRLTRRFAGRSIGFRRDTRTYVITFSKGGAVKGTYGEVYGGDESTTQYFNDAGSWSVRNNRLCVKWRSWDGARNICYALNGNSLSGGGVLRGSFLYR